MRSGGARYYMDSSAQRRARDRSGCPTIHLRLRPPAPPGAGFGAWRERTTLVTALKLRPMSSCNVVPAGAAWKLSTDGRVTSAASLSSTGGVASTADIQRWDDSEEVSKGLPFGRKGKPKISAYSWTSCVRPCWFWSRWRRADRSLRDRSNGSLRDHGHLGIHAHLRITFTDHLGITFIDDGGGEGGGKNTERRFEGTENLLCIFSNKQ